MATDRPRLQAYLDPELHQRFAEWKQERGIAKDSEALNGLLAEYFGVSSQSPIPNPQSPTTDELRILIQEELWDSGKQDFIEGIKLEAQEMISREVAVAKEYWKSIDSREQTNLLQKRLEALEQRIVALEPEATATQEEYSELPVELPVKPLLTQTELAKRFGCHKSLISRHKASGNFEEWSRKKDPDAIAWKYNRDTQKFTPVR